MAKLDSCFAGIAGATAIEGQLIPVGAEFPVFPELLEWAKTAPYTTTPQLFMHAYNISKDRPFVGKRVGDHFEFETYDDVYKKICGFASALISLGLQPGDRIANFSDNRPEWRVVDYGSAFAACIHVPMYATLSKQELAYILRDCGAKIAVAGSADHLRKLLSIENDCPELEHIIAITPTGETSSKHLWTWDEFIEFGKVRYNNNANHIDYLQKKLRAWDVASLVYTSGTTGDPKGVMLMHGNLCSQAHLLQERILPRQDDVEISFLPLSHVFERAINYLYTAAGACFAYTQGIHMLMQDLVDLKPTVLPCVPVFLHKMYDRIMINTNIKRAPSLKWAIKVGRSYGAAMRAGRVSRILRAQQAMAQSLLSKDIKKRLGDNIRVVISGGAPLRKEVAQFFNDLDIMVLEGYGLTETSPVLSVCHFNSPQPGTVGPIMDGLDVRIEDGEVVVRGPNIMRGYYKHPEETAATFDVNGYFHTGDIGEFDDKGNLRITDRKKCIIVLANGKNVAPAGIEQALCRSKWIMRAVLVGDNAQHIAALIVPDMDKVTEWAKQKELPGTIEDWTQNSELRAIINNDVHDACLNLSNYEKVKRIAILSHDFSLAAGELTHSMKVKHRVIEENYADLIKNLLL
ncbi:long-chain fatty acid--CoA ligase [bacterium]|nr:long-chain fatty acid--CoA ligase [bacterium]